MKRFLIVCLSLSLLAPFSRGDDDTWHNIYHSLKRFGHHVKDKFSDDDDHSSGSTHRRTTATTHKSTTSKKAKESTSPSPSPTPATGVEDSAVGAPTPTPVPMPVTPTGPSPTPDETPLATPPPEVRPQPTAPLIKPESGPDKSQTRNEPKPTPEMVVSKNEDKPDKPDSSKSDDQAKSDDQKEAKDDQKEGKDQKEAKVTSLKPEEIAEYASQPEKIQKLITSALALTSRNLYYQYGSADPSSGGMDCSGYIYYVLKEAGYPDVPRQSSDQYAWVRKQSDFHSVLSRNLDTFELKELRPGDLMFWSGTYKADRDIPITHVMFYLGTEKATGKPVMVGASDGRSYNGVRQSGVSVFDFKLPSGKANKTDPELVAKFEGYGTVPGLRGGSMAYVDQSEPEKSPSPSPTPKKKLIKKKQTKKEE